MRFAPVLLVILLLGCSSFQPARERISVNLRSPRLPAGSVEAVFDAMTRTGTRTGEIQAFYFPEDDVVCLEFRHAFTTFYQFWSETNRAAFVSALEQYKLDFEQRNLTRSNSRSKRRYGTVSGYLIWESTRFSGQGFSYPDIEIGYQFKNNAPYFSVTMREAANTSDSTKDSLPSNSNINIYFTRALADDLAALFDEGFLRSLRLAVPDSGEPDREVVREVY